MNALTVKNKMKTDTNGAQLAALYAQIKANGDRANAAKLLDLYEKLEKNELIISIAGHFSSGKSSMINALMGEDILPKSPIPTSANVVKLTSGEGVARVYFTTEDPVEYKEPYDIDMIKEYSKDKEAIKKIEISTKRQIIPHGAAIIDTPGIDAADDADRIMTEASLHLADMLFYVMDYNHVQSEVNLQFLKAIQELELPYYVVVNQIDKHDEREIAFHTFDKNIKQTFDQWNLKPVDVYYTSLVAPDAPHNQFKEIKAGISSIMGADRHSYSTIDQSIRQVMNAHKEFLKATYEEKMGKWENTEQVQVKNQELNNLESIQKKLQDLKMEPKNFETDFMEELQQTLNNAYLMPASLRDQAHSYLESQQSDFKIGLFGSKRKTEEERNNRESSFLSALIETMHTSIQWKLRDKFSALLKKYDLHDSTLQNSINEMEVVYDGDDLATLIKPGAKVNGDYVLNYTNDVAAAIKAKYRQAARSILQSIQTFIRQKNKASLAELQQIIAALEAENNKNNELLQLKDALNDKYIQLEKQLFISDDTDSNIAIMKQELNLKPRPIRQTTKGTHKSLLASKEKQVVTELKGISTTNTNSIDQVLTSIDETIQAIEGLPGFESFANDLLVKESRLQNRSYTIALFGAFSAGKSSFANALMGEKVLPVSPNPTTATVNRIRPLNEKQKHGDVVVTLKNHDALAHDLRMITKKLVPESTEFHSLMDWVVSNQIDKNPKLNKMYQSYLQAMIRGYEVNKDLIGKSITITLADFESYVTDETKACYIESIDLYYDCALTRQGITLVDTPGADSVNARHTNVAFEYIKHADAILYVTYYNHALSRADKDFLMQLGRVKEAFQLDKMFFIVNAADLAADAKELTLVTDYVQDQLLQLGIRLPKLYPVSSKSSLEDKLQGIPLNEQMKQLENDFYQFINHDLAALTVDSALWDIRRASHAVDNYIKSLNMDKAEKENRKQNLLAKKKQLIAYIQSFSTNAYEEQTLQKMDKQLFYILERLSIRYHDMFKEMFNPTTITESGRKAQNQLRSSLENLLEYIGFELFRELQATSLRVESYIYSQLIEVHQLLAKKSVQIDPLFELPDMKEYEMESPVFKEVLTKVDTREFDPLFSRFKGTKAFFVNNEKEFMKEAMYGIIKPYAEQYIESNKSLMLNSYMQQWETTVHGMKLSIRETVDLQWNNYLQMLTTAVDIKVLTQKQELLRLILKQYGKKDVS